MSDEQIATRLFVEYDDALAAGQTPDRDDFLRRCPEAERKELADALDGVRFLREHWPPPKMPPVPSVKPETVDRIMADIQAIRRRREGERDER